MHRYRHLMVGLRRSQSDRGLIGYAALLLRLGTFREVRFVHVLPPQSDGARSPDHGRALAELETEVAAGLEDVPQDVRVACDVLKGPLVDRCLEFAVEQEIDLVLVGNRPRRSGHRALARRLAMQAPCSVLMRPDGARAQLHRILVPVDFSDHAADTLRVATAMARLSGATRCLALHVHLHRIILTGEETHHKIGYEECRQVPHGQEDAVFHDFLQRIPDYGVTVVPLFREGSHVAHIIHRTAIEEDADLIVMSTRGRTRSAAILLGSVTDELILETRIPLLVVKHFGAQRRLIEVLLDRAFGSGKK